MNKLDLTTAIPLDKTCLIEASAGTGKTFSIANIFLHAVLSEIPVAQILVVTFTEAATKELRGRIRENMTNALACLKHENDDAGLNSILNERFVSLDDSKKHHLLETALLNIDQAAIFTVHSFCQRMLTENAFESKIVYGAELLTDPDELIQELAENFWREHLVNIPASEAELYVNLKFDNILNLTKELVRYHDVEVVNNVAGEFEDVPDEDEQLTAAYQQIIAETKLWSKQFINGDLKAEIVALFEAVSDSCKGIYAKDITPEIDKLISALAGGKTTNVKKFTQASVANALKATAVKQGIQPPQHELFNFCSRYLDIVSQQNALEKSRNAALATNQHCVELVILNRLNDYIKARYQAIKAARNVLTFDDLLVRLYEILKSADGSALTNLIRKKFRLALVDEFQDTDNIQYKIFRQLFGNKKTQHGFFMIGDPKQSIYKFRSADIFCYLAAKQDVDITFTLATNYRSEANMVAAVNELFMLKGAADTFAFPPVDGQEGIIYQPIESGARKAVLIDAAGNNAALQFWLVKGFNARFAERNIAFNVADEIIRLMEDSTAGKAYFAHATQTPLRLEDMAILVNTNKQATMMKDILAKRKIAAVIQNSVKIFDSWEARELQLWLKAVMMPIEKNIRPLFVTNLLHYPVDEINQLNDQAIMQLTEELTLLNRLWQKNGFFSLLLRFISKYKTKEKVLAKINGERIITNYLHLAELLHKHEIKAGRGIEKTLSYLEHQLAESGSDDEFVQRLESDRNAVKIMTIHKSKGLEFPIVFCPFLWNNAITKGEGKQQIFLFNTAVDNHYIQQLDFGGDKDTRTANYLLARREVLAEHIRLIYVAVTRAANRCYLPIGEVKNSAMSVLAYLFTSNSVEHIVTNAPKSAASKRLPEILTNIVDTLKEFSESSEHVSLENKTASLSSALLPQVTAHEPVELTARQFDDRYLYQWGVGSFSNLIAGQSYTGEQIELGSGIFSLPKGKNFGIAVHKVFQNYFSYGKDEFYLHSERYIEHPLKVEDYFRSPKPATRKEHFELARAMIANVLELPITKGGTTLKLGDIAVTDARPEFQFFYRINKISAKLLQAIFVQHGINEIKQFAEELGSLTFSLGRGYMKGDIDLLFRDNGKYYLLDWKTNYLGPRAEDYNAEQLRSNMAEHYYILQAHIYSLAVHLFLKQQLQNYSYAKDFGGFFYIYTRGMDRNGNGVYFNKPSQALIEAMANIIVN